jgi:hypothetical protein
MLHAKQKERPKGRKEMDYWLIAYIVVSIIIGTGSSGFLYKRQQTVAAILTFILLLLIFIFYGLRWFSGGNLKGSKEGTVAWPPIVNLCPDFMISYKDTAGNIYCYDAKNAYNLKTAAAIPEVSVANIINTTDTGYKIMDTAGVSGDLKADIATAGTKKWPLLTKFATNPSAIVASTNTNNKLLRWEGVWDGRYATPEKLQPLP